MEGEQATKKAKKILGKRSASHKKKKPFGKSFKGTKEKTLKEKCCR